MSIDHKTITDPELHSPKGFDSAASETALVKNLLGQVEWRDLSILGATGPTGPTGATGSPASIENEVIVQKDPLSGQFSTITDALNSITDASATNRYMISVGPGIYVESITMKEYVFIRGSKRATILQPSDSSSHIVIGIDNSSISNMILEGAGTNFAAIYMADGAAGGEFNAERIIFRTNHHFVYIDSTGGETSVVLSQCEPGLTANTVQPFVVTGTGTGTLRINNFVSPMQSPTCAITDFVFVTGTGNTVIATNFIVNLQGGATATYGYRVNNGGTILTVSNIMTGFGTAIYAENSGSAPMVRVSAVGITGSTTLDLNIEHPGTVGNVGGNFDTDKVSIDDATSSTFKMVALDSILPSVGITVLGDIIQSETFSERVNVSLLTRESSMMGWVDDGATLLTDAGTLDLTVAAGTGFVVDTAGQFVKQISWSSDTLTLADDSDLYIHINNNGVITADAAFPDVLEEILLGRVVTKSGDIYFVEESPMNISHNGDHVNNMLLEAFGPIFPVSGGCVVSENSGTPFALDITSGFYWLGTRKISPTGGTSITWDAFYGGTNTVSQNLVDGAQYDNAGTLTALTSSWYAKHLFCVVEEGSDQKFLLVYAQEQYATLAEAVEADRPTLPTIFKDAVVSVASLIVQEGASAIDTILDERPRAGFKATGSLASAEHGNLGGLSNDDHPQYLLVSGSRAMTGDLDMGTHAITNVGNVDGVDVSAHASRHNPGGSDAITTAAAIELTDSTNAEGTAASVARSDHTHAHGNRGGGSLHANAIASGAAGFMTGTDKAKLDGIASGAQVNLTVRNVYIPASYMIPNATAPAQPGARELATNDPNIFYFAFDGTTDEIVNFQFPMPQDWNNGTIVFKPYWTAASGSGTVQFELRGAAVSNDDPLDATWGTPQESTDTLLAANDLHIGPTSPAITIAGSPATADYISFELRRDVSDDTMATDAQLLGIFIQYTVTGSNPTAF